MKPHRHRSKTAATWIALAAGSFGLHRFYLKGMGDRWGWLIPLPTLAGLFGVQRMLTYGQDDRLAWVLIPLLGLTIAGSMLTAIVYGLTPDDKWDARHNPQGPHEPAGWLAVIGVVLALMIGGAVLMATIAFSGQRYFEATLQDDERMR